MSGITVTKKIFGNLAGGAPVDIYTLAARSGIEARIMSYGAALVSLRIPDRQGTSADIILGFDTLDGYLGAHPYFGVTAGRYANRIAGARFVLNGVEYQLAANDGPNHLHGGIKGFDKVLWRAEPIEERTAAGVRLSYVSRDMEEGYPGTLQAVVTYRLTAVGELRIDYEASTDKTTHVNLTNHAYWNLSGREKIDVLGHVLRIEADKYTEVDSSLIPTGNLPDVKDTPFDFRKPQVIGERINQVQGGYDHNFVIRSRSGLALAAVVHEPGSGRFLEIYTDQPGIQFYSGNFLDGTITGKGGQVYGRHAGFCLETQHFPDSPNHREFPSTLLEPGRKYSTVTIHRFGVK